MLSVTWAANPTRWRWMSHLVWQASITALTAAGSTVAERGAGCPRAFAAALVCQCRAGVRRGRPLRRYCGGAGRFRRICPVPPHGARGRVFRVHSPHVKHATLYRDRRRFRPAWQLRDDRPPAGARQSACAAYTPGSWPPEIWLASAGSRWMSAESLRVSTSSEGELQNFPDNSGQEG